MFVQAGLFTSSLPIKFHDLYSDLKVYYAVRVPKGMYSYLQPGKPRNIRSSSGFQRLKRISVPIDLICIT
jgi:hypothetical protein